MTGPDIEMLAWDSEHYGYPVARIRARRLEEPALARTLEQARREGIALLYWFRESGQEPSPDLCTRFGGRYVGGHARYARVLSPHDDQVPPAPFGLAVADERGTSADPALTALAIATSELSRFRVDDRLPRAKCDEMYAIWLAKSLRGELADATLVARRERGAIGLVTLRARHGVVELGLVGTALHERGRGVASHLLRVAHAAGLRLGAASVEVVTQTENVAACALYERAGYRLVDSARIYHFLPRLTP